MPSFANVRRKCHDIESMCDLVSIIMAEGKNLEVFAMSVWLIWLWRNKLGTNENPQPCSKKSPKQPCLCWPSFSKENRGR